MGRLIIGISALVAFFAAFELHAQTPTQTKPGKPVLNADKLGMAFLDGMNSLAGWHISMDGKEDEVNQVVDRMMEQFAADVIAEVPPHDEEQLGPVMLVGSAQVRKWVDKIARSKVDIAYVIKRQTEKEFEGEYMIFSRPLPWGGIGVAIQVIAAATDRFDRRRYMEPGAVFLQFNEAGKIWRLRLIQAEKDEVVALQDVPR